MLKIALVLGTTREGNKSHAVAKFVNKVAEDVEGIEVTFVDVYDHVKDAENHRELAADAEWTKIVKESDGFVFVIPEYNHSYPGSFKMLLDKELKNYIHKPAAMVGVSAGPWGGSRAVEHLVPVLRELGLVATFSNTYFTDSYNLFDENGKMTQNEERATDNVKAMFEELVWMAQTLKHGRDNIPSQHHK